MSRVGARVDELTAEADDASRAAPITVRGWVPGPAGTATLDLLDGRAELHVDVAEPDLLVALRLLDPLDEQTRRLARILLGPTAASGLGRSRQTPGEPVVVWERTEDRVRMLRGRGTSPGGLGLVGRLGLGLAEVSAPGRSDAAIAVGLVEAGIAAHDLRGDLAPAPDGPTLVRAGIARWEALAPASLDAVVDLLARQQGRWLKSAHAIDPSLVERVQRLFERDLRHEPPAAARGAPLRSAGEPDLFDMANADVLDLAQADLLESASDALAAAPAAVAGGSAPRPMGRSELTVEFDALLASAGARVVGTERLDHHLVVHLAGLPDDGPDPWLRVFTRDPAGPVPLAVAPVAASDRPWRTAVALVPSEVPGHDLIVDVTVSPKDPLPTPTARAVATAVQLGAHAAQASRRGDPAAGYRWRDAASAWVDLGDDHRTDLAQEYASSPPSADPLLADLL